MVRKTLLIGAVALAMCVTSGVAMAGIAGGAHDFSSVAGGWAQGEICKPCHTPHHAQAFDVSKRLWNHELTTATYIVRNGPSGFNADGSVTEGARDVLDTTSYLCMGCHDGTIALDAFGSATTEGLGSGGHFIGHDGDLGADRRMDHPVGLEAIMKNTGTYASRYKPITQSVSSTGSTSYRVMVGSNSLSLIKLTDPTGSVAWTRTDTGGVTTTGTETGVSVAIGCRTCHNPHSNTDKLLNTVNNAASQLCLGCHVK